MINFVNNVLNRLNQKTYKLRFLTWFGRARAIKKAVDRNIVIYNPFTTEKKLTDELFRFLNRELTMRRDLLEYKWCLVDQNEVKDNNFCMAPGTTQLVLFKTKKSYVFGAY